MNNYKLKRASGILSVIAATAFINLADAQTINWGQAGPVYTAGRSRNMLVDRNNVNTLYVGSAASGVFKSPDAGVSWAPIDDQAHVKNISYMAQSVDNVIYVATGEGFLRPTQKAKSQKGTGLYKLTGATLTKVADSSITGKEINRIACSPVNANHIALATNLGILVSTDGGTSFSKATGIPTGSIITGMDVKFDNTGVLYCSVGNERGAITGDPRPYANIRSKIYKASSANFGAFTDITPYSTLLPDSVYGRIELAIAPSNNAVIYASCARKYNGASNSASLKGLFVSYNGGATWGLVLVGTPQLDPLSNGGTQASGDYAHVLTVSPGNSDMLFIGGFQTYMYVRDRSKGSDASPLGKWTKIGNHLALGFPMYLHQNVHDIKIIPGSPVKFYFITDAGIYRSTDLASAGDLIPPSFQRFYKGLITGQFNSVSIERYPVTASVSANPGYAYKPYSGFIGGTAGNGLIYFSGTPAFVTQETSYIGGEFYNAEYSKILPDAAFATSANGSLFRSSNVRTSPFTPVNINVYSGTIDKVAPSPTGFNNADITTGTPFRLWENYGNMKVSPDSAYFYNDTVRVAVSMAGVSTLTTQTTFTFEVLRPFGNKFAMIDSVVIRTGTVLIPGTTPPQIPVAFTNADKKDIRLKLANNYTVGTGLTAVPLSYSNGPVAAAGVTLDAATLRDVISVKFTTPPFETKTLTAVSGGGDPAAYYKAFAVVFYKYKAGDSVSVVDDNISTKTFTYTSALTRPLSWAYGSNLPSYVITAPVNTAIPSPTYVLNPGNITQSSPSFTVKPFTSTTYTVSQRGTYSFTAVPVVYSITAVTSSAIPSPTYVLMPDSVVQSTPDYTVNPFQTTSYTITELFSAEETYSTVSTAYLANPGNYTAGPVYVVSPTVTTVYTLQALSTDTMAGESTSVTHTAFAVNTVTTVGPANPPDSPNNPLVKIPTSASARLAMALNNANITGGAQAIVVAKNALNLNDPLNFVRVSQSGCYTDDANGNPSFNTITIPGKPILLEWSKSGTEIYFATSTNKLYRVSHITDILDLSSADFAGKIYTDVYKYASPVTATNLTLNPSSPYRTTEIGSFQYPVTSISVSNDDKSLVVTLQAPNPATGTVVVTNTGDVRKANSTAIQWQKKNGNLPTEIGQIYCSLIEKDSARIVFVGTDIGVFRTMDIRAAEPVWANVGNDQLPRVQIFDMKQQTIEPWGSYNSGAIYVATNGRGVWSTDAYFTPYVVSVEEQQIPRKVENNLSIYPNPTNAHVNVLFNSVDGEDALINVMDINGRVVMTRELGKLSTGEMQFTFDTGSLSPGIYIVNINSNSGIKRVSKLIVTK